MIGNNKQKGKANVCNFARSNIFHPVAIPLLGTWLRGVHVYDQRHIESFEYENVN